MTPEMVIVRLFDANPGLQINSLDLANDICSAVEAEREACAQIAEAAVLWSRVDEEDGAHSRWPNPKSIAKRIRARGDK